MPLKVFIVVMQVMLLLHLVTAFPIITNPPTQFFEHLLKIPAGAPSVYSGATVAHPVL